MPHIHTEPGQHDHTASAFIVRFDEGVPKLLLHKHKKLGRLMQPGGHVELHETPWQAVLHEISEETGYDIAQLQVMQPADRLKHMSGEAKLHPVPMTHSTHKYSKDVDHYHTDSNYLFVTDELPAGKPLDDESAELRWLTCEELKALEPHMTFENIREVGLHMFAAYLNSWERVDIKTFAA